MDKKIILIHVPALCNLKEKIFEPLERDNYIRSRRIFFDFKEYFSRLGFIIKNSSEEYKLEDVKTLICFDFEKLDSFVKKVIHFNKDKINNHKIKLSAILWEPPLIIPNAYDRKTLKYFDAILTWNNNLVDNKKIFKFHWPEEFELNKKSLSFNEKEFMCVINENKMAIEEGELYSERKRMIDFFTNKEEGINVFGRGWDEKQISLISIGHVIKRSKNLLVKLIKLDFKFFYFLLNYWFNFRKIKISSVKGPFKESVIEVTSRYKFSICLENTNAYPGYSTEKIFNCFNARTIPIYKGDKEIKSNLLQKSYIDLEEFKDYNSLRNYLINLTQEEYELYINNINLFLEEQSKGGLYSSKTFFSKIKKNLI